MKAQTYFSPTGNPEVWNEKPDGYFTPEEWLEAHPPEVPEPDPAAEAEAAMFMAQAEAGQIITASIQRQAVQTMAFSAAEFGTFAKAGLFDPWQAGAAYEAGQRIVNDGIVYEVIQPVTSQAGQKPGAEGMLAIYRPISADPESGDEPDGTPENPIAFISGMDVVKDKYYSYNGLVYLAKSDMVPCVWPPDTPGLWQWEVVNG